MRINHRIVFEVTESLQHEFDSLGFKLKLGQQALEVFEDDERWFSVCEIVDRIESFHTFGAKFSKDEIDSASFLYMDFPESLYPKPEKNYEFLRITYDDNCACPGGDLTRFPGGIINGCGQGYNQIAPFRVGKLPKLERLPVFGFHWIFDVVLVRRDTYEQIFQPLGIEHWPVLTNRTSEAIDSIVQLKIDNEVDVDTSGLEYRDCQYCGRRKYMINRLRFYPAPEPIDSPIFLSKQRFGAGLHAFRLIYVSNELYRIIKQANLKSVSFLPCAEPGW